MSDLSRDERLAADLENLRSVKKRSELFDFECNGNAPDRYTLIFHGKGISRGLAVDAEIEEVDLHRCNLRLPYSYPVRPPDIRWLTPIFHPNVSFSGFINLKDIGIKWESHLTLEFVCQRLWDVARFEHFELTTATNYAAKTWFEGNPEFVRPVDKRPLLERRVPSGSNVVKYERRGAKVALPEVKQDEELFYIDENTPIPQLPGMSLDSREGRADDDVIYIGYD